MKAYISVSFSKRKSVEKEIAALVNTLNDFKISAFVFVDNYKFESNQEQQMMATAMSDIDNCDILIAETSDKAIGVGIEAGYAKAKNKIVIYIRRIDKEHSTTVSGISNFQIIYRDTTDLKKQLSEVLLKIKQTNN